MTGIHLSSRAWRARFAVTMGIGVCAAFAFPAAAAAATPPTLSGESLSAPETIFVIQCAQSGAFSYTVSGTAVGPYPGTFTAAVTGSVGPSPLLASFSESFTISSTVGSVTGTESGSPATAAACQDGGLTAGSGDWQFSYRATIKAATGSYTDRGTSDVFDFQTGPGVPNGLDENFTSALSHVTATSDPQGQNNNHQGQNNSP